MRNKQRRWQREGSDDPLAGMVNLFDLWMVFSIALLLALVSHFRVPELLSRQSDERPANASPSPMEVTGSKRYMLTRYRVSQAKLKGEGLRLGTAYRLKNGEVVYVPD